MNRQRPAKDHVNAMLYGPAKFHYSTTKGELHPQAILTDQDARDIYQSGELAAVLAEKYGISRDLVYKIRQRKAWRHIHQ